MSLGEVMQAVSAFMMVQGAFGWLVENYPRFADWSASASRLASLLVSLDRLECAEREPTNGRIVRTPAERGALRLRDVSVTLGDGSAVVNEADLEIGPGEKVQDEPLQTTFGRSARVLARLLTGRLPRRA